MNILQISASDNLVGGASRVARSLKSAYDRLGLTNSMIVGSKFSTDPDIQAIPKNLLNKALSYLLANDLEFFQSDYILTTPAFKQADIIHCHNLHGWYFKLETLTKMASLKPVVWTLHDMWAITPHCAHSFNEVIKEGFYQCADKNIYPGLLWHNEKHLSKVKAEIYQRSTFQLVSPSAWLKTKIEQSLLKNKPLTVIPNGIDPDIYRPLDQTASRKELGLPLDKKIILFTSPSDIDNPFKGGQYFLQVAGRCQTNNDYLFICLGGDRRQQTGNILYLPKTADQSMMAKYFSSADIYLFTSVAENFPLTVLEALACGTPIVSFEVGGVPEVLTHRENGYLVKNQDLNDIINGINWLLALPDQQKRIMADSSISKITSHYSLTSMAENYLKLYQKLIK